MIGGCAVGSYARIMGLTVLSGDLDLLASPQTLSQCLLQLEKQGIKIRQRPQPRNIPVAFFQWEGKEVNILTSSLGLPDPDDVWDTSRTFHLQDTTFQVADPVHLLRNKLKVRRDKDLPHIEILDRFIVEEIVSSFREDIEPRQRLSLAKRYLSTIGSRTLPEALAARLIPLARLPSDFRFLINCVLTEEQIEAVYAAAPEALVEELKDLHERSR